MYISQIPPDNILTDCKFYILDTYRCTHNRGFTSILQAYSNISNRIEQLGFANSMINLLFETWHFYNTMDLSCIFLKFRLITY